MHTTAGRPKITVTADGRGVASHAGTRLLTDLAEATGLTEALGAALSELRCASRDTTRAGWRWIWQP